METTLLTTEVKVKTCFFILYLCCQHYFLETNASIKKSDVAKYLIRREAGRGVGDVFSVMFKQGCHQDRCNPTDMNQFCANLSAHSTSSPENFRYSCSCKSPTLTFLPEGGKCVTNEEASNNLKGCSQYKVLSWWKGLFLNGFDLRKNGRHSCYLNEPLESCTVIPRSPMYYDNLESGWKRISSEIFTVRFQQGNEIVLEWQADTNDTLSGRILRLIVTCNYTKAAAKPPLNGCLLIKAMGAVTCECAVMQTWHVVQI